MNDHIADEDLAAYVDGALQGAPRAELESHLSRCPECLAALAEIVDIQGSAVKIPADFLRQALGEKPPPAKAAPPMRLVLGIAAVFLVAVMVGFLFVGRERVKVARAGENGMMRPTAVAEDHRPADKVTEAGPARRQAAARTVPLQEGQAERGEKSAMGKKLAAGGAVPDRLASRQAVEASVKASPPLKEEIAQGTAAADRARPEGVEGGAVGGVLGGVEAPAEKDKKSAIMPAAVAAIPEARAEEGEQSVEKMARRAVAPVRAKGAAGAGLDRAPALFPGAVAADEARQFFLAVTGRAAAPPAVEIADPARRPAIRIVGDVSRADLVDPGLLDSWSWFPEGLALRLEIDPAGAVVAVVPVGSWSEPSAALAQAAARELRFPASGKKSRRAVLSDSAPPN